MYVCVIYAYYYIITMQISIACRLRIMICTYMCIPIHIHTNITGGGEFVNSVSSSIRQMFMGHQFKHDITTFTNYIAYYNSLVLRTL